MGKDIQDYLDKALYGTPQLKPDEQKKYLGTYRERVVFVLLLSELSQSSFEPFATDKIQKYKNGTLLVNALVNPTIQKKLIAFAQKNNILLKLVDVEHAQLNDDSIAVVYALDHAVNISDINLSTSTVNKSEVETNHTDNNKPTSQNFLKSFFKKK